MGGIINFRKQYKVYLWSLLVIVVLCLFYSWLSDIFSGESGRVRKLIMAGKRAVEEKNIFACPGMISLNYHDKYGNDRQSLLYITKEAFNYYKAIFVQVNDMAIKFDDSKMQADVDITALIIGQTQQDTKEKILEAEKGKFKIKLIKEDNKWRVLEVESFEPITLMGQSMA